MEAVNSSFYISWFSVFDNFIINVAIEVQTQLSKSHLLRLMFNFLKALNISSWI